MFEGRWFITPHAVHRYMARIARRLIYEEALAELASMSLTARYVKPAQGGAELWRTGKPLRLRFIVGPGEGDLPALLTVLPGHDRW